MKYAMLVVLVVCGSGGSNAQAGDDAQEVRLRVASWDDVQTTVKQHRGKIVVIDVWMTTCVTCLEEFPHFLEWQTKYGPDKVTLISVNCDYDGIATKPPKYYRPNVSKFLRKQHAKIDNVMLSDPFLDFLNRIDLSSTPAIFVYDQHGKLVKRFDNDGSAAEEFAHADVAKLLDRLTSEKP